MRAMYATLPSGHVKIMRSLGTHILLGNIGIISLDRRQERGMSKLGQSNRAFAPDVPPNSNPIPSPTVQTIPQIRCPISSPNHLISHTLHLPNTFKPNVQQPPTESAPDFLKPSNSIHSATTLPPGPQSSAPQSFNPSPPIPPAASATTYTPILSSSVLNSNSLSVQPCLSPLQSQTPTDLNRLNSTNPSPSMSVPYLQPNPSNSNRHLSSLPSGSVLPPSPSVPSLSAPTPICSSAPSNSASHPPNLDSNPLQLPDPTLPLQLPDSPLSPNRRPLIQSPSKSTSNLSRNPQSSESIQIPTDSISVRHNRLPSGVFSQSPLFHSHSPLSANPNHPEPNSPLFYFHSRVPLKSPTRNTTRP
ncbi:hypothetical protein U1Q18_037544, partial [Sarracenia purpurea var. burkii]